MKVFRCLLGSALLPGFLVAAVTALDIRPAANTIFRDETANDRTGGWIDLGGNDLRDLKPGALSAAGVPFAIAPVEKSCAIVLGGDPRPYLSRQAMLPVPELSGAALYLLHATAFAPASHDPAGTLRLVYSDGSTETKEVRLGRDACDWTSSQSFANAARAWTVYNGNTQVSLFVSKFALKPVPLREATFTAQKACWMIAAVSIGSDQALSPLKKAAEPTRSFRSPPPFGERLTSEAVPGRPKNVILIIGDGMGQGAVAYTSLRQYGLPGRTLFEQAMPVATLCSTFSASSPVTDSAASGTAYSCGSKTANGRVAMLPDGTELQSVATLAKCAGKAVAILTNDKLQGATPAVFYSHARERGDAQRISGYLPLCGFDVLVGRAESAPWYLPKTKGGKRTDSRDIIDEMTVRGYACVDTIEKVAEAPAGHGVLASIGPELLQEDGPAKLLAATLGRIGKNPAGFFVMIESTYPDYGGHGNDPDLTLLGVTQVEWLAREALTYARDHRDTLVIVTADHETGGIQTIATSTPCRPRLYYATASHTGACVPLYAYGPGSSSFGRLVDDTDIAITIRSFIQP